MKRFVIPTLLLLLAHSLYAQELEWKAGMFHFFDNTEFSGSNYTDDQTMAGVRLAPEVGLGWGNHHLSAGFDALHSWGTDRFVDGVVPTAYYRYDDGNLSLYMGSFARAGKLDAFNRAFFSDSIGYYRPNINGILLAYRTDELQTSAFLDWTGKKDSTVHEAFFVGGSLGWHSSIFLAEVQAFMFHYASSIRQSGVRDNLLLKPAVGLDLTSWTWLDTLTFKVGLLTGIERHRALTDAFTRTGGTLLELDARYQGFGLQANAYWGKNLMMEYSSMGSNLYWGDPFYRGDFYARVDVNWDFFHQRGLDARLNMANHFSEGRYYLEQRLIVRVLLDSNDNKHFHGKK